LKVKERLNLEIPTFDSRKVTYISYFELDLALIFSLSVCVVGMKVKVIKKWTFIVSIL